VPGGDGHDIRNPPAVQIPARPTVGYVEVFIHGSFRLIAGSSDSKWNTA